MRIHAFITICFLIALNAPAQNPIDTTKRDLIDYTMKILKRKPPRDQDQLSRKVRFSIVPVTAGSEGQVAISAINFAFYQGETELTNLSTVYFYPYASFTGRYSFIVISDLWSSGNTYFSNGDFRISSNSYNDYGLGSSSSEDSSIVVDYNHARIRFDVNRNLFGFLYAGIGYSLDYYYDIAQKAPEFSESDFENYPYGTSRTAISSGMTFNLFRDKRKNSINPEGGYYGSVSYNFFHPSLGSTYTWNSLYVDLRRYYLLNTEYRSILAMRLFYWDTWGEVPYLDQPATFTDRESRIARGYSYSRFRGKGMLFGEAEYRFSISKNQFWGGVVFANAQSLREPSSDIFEAINPAAGIGLRVKFNKRSNTNLTLDVAEGRDGLNWYINIGEYF